MSETWDDENEPEIEIDEDDADDLDDDEETGLWDEPAEADDDD